jgi:MFS family permease
MIEVASPEYYYPFIIAFVIIFALIEAVITIVKNRKEKEELSDQEKLLLSDVEFVQKGRDLKKKYIVVFLLSKAAMWAKAPYTFMLLSTYYKFSLGEIGVLYLLDAIAALLAGPFLGLVSDTFGRKFTSSFYCISNIITISCRVSGVVPLAYFAQICTGCFGGILNTSYEAWLNYEISKLYGDQQKYQDKFRKNIFAKINIYDSILSIIVTIIGTILYVTNFNP